MKKITTILLTIFMLLSLTACGQDQATTAEPATEVATEGTAPVAEEEESIEEIQEEAVPEIEASRYPLTVTDKFGNEVVIENAPETMISMSPEITEIIFALGAGEKLIGRSSYCNYPAEAASVQDFGSLFDLNIESIVAAQADVIFLSSMASEELVTTLMTQGLTVITFDKDSNLEGTYAYMTSVGAIIDKVEEAALLSDGIRAQVAEVASKIVGAAETPEVYYVVYAGDGYDSTATGDTFIHDMIQTAGGDNIAKEGSNWSYSVETLVEQDPWMIFCSNNDGSKTKIQGLEGYKDLTAVKEDRLFEVDPDIFSRQGPRVGDAVEVLARLMHPDMFK